MELRQQLTRALFGRQPSTSRRPATPGHGGQRCAPSTIHRPRRCATTCSPSSGACAAAAWRLATATSQADGGTPAPTRVALVRLRPAQLVSRGADERRHQSPPRRSRSWPPRRSRSCARRRRTRRSPCSSASGARSRWALLVVIGLVATAVSCEQLGLRPHGIGDDLHVQHGLLDRRQHTMPRHRLQHVRVARQPRPPAARASSASQLYSAATPGRARQQQTATSRSRLADERVGRPARACMGRERWRPTGAAAPRRRPPGAAPSCGAPRSPRDRRDHRRRRPPRRPGRVLAPARRCSGCRGVCTAHRRAGWSLDGDVLVVASGALRAPPRADPARAGPEPAARRVAVSSAGRASPPSASTSPAAGSAPRGAGRADGPRRRTPPCDRSSVTRPRGRVTAPAWLDELPLAARPAVARDGHPQPRPRRLAPRRRRPRPRPRAQGSAAGGAPRRGVRRPRHARRWAPRRSRCSSSCSRPPGSRAVPADLHPLDAAGRLVQEDLCLMVLRDGAPHLDAASLCFPSYWRLADKLGRPMADVHGPVAHYADELAAKVDTFLQRLRPERPVWRRNWSIHDDPTLLPPRPHPAPRRRPARRPLAPQRAPDAAPARPPPTWCCSRSAPSRCRSRSWPSDPTSPTGMADAIAAWSPELRGLQGRPRRPRRRALACGASERGSAVGCGHVRTRQDPPDRRPTTPCPAAPRRCRSPTRHHVNGAHPRPRLPARDRDRRVRHGLLLGRRAEVLGARRRVLHGGRLRRRLHAQPHLRGDLHAAAPATPRSCSSPTTPPR